MFKELTKQEVAIKLANEGCFEGYVKNDTFDYSMENITGVDFYGEYNILAAGSAYYKYCAIEIPDEYEPYPDDECPPLNCGDIVVSKKGYPTELMVTMVTREGNTKHIHLFDWKYNKFLFDSYTHIDGSPIGRVKGNK